MTFLNTNRTITLSNQKIFLIAKHITEKIKLATKIPKEKINYDMLLEIWYDYLDEELQDEERNLMQIKMIYIEIYTHSSSIDGSISFEENDLRVSSIGDNEILVKKDFDKLWESINEIETKDFKAEEWYMLAFKRNWDDDGSYSYWFELIDSNLIEAEL